MYHGHDAFYFFHSREPSRYSVRLFFFDGECARHLSKLGSRPPSLDDFLRIYRDFHSPGAPTPRHAPFRSDAG